MALPRSPRFLVLSAATAGLAVLLLVTAVLLWRQAGDASMLRGLAVALPLAGLVLGMAMVGVLLLEIRSRERAVEVQQLATKKAEKAHADFKRVAGEVEQLGHLGDQLRPCRSVEEITEVLGASMKSVLSQFHGALYLQTPARNVLRRSAHWGKGGAALEELFTPDDCWALRRQTAYPTATDSPPCKHLAEGVNAAHTCCVPLLAQGEILGVLHIAGDLAPAPVEKRIAQNIADLLAQSLANLRLLESMRVASVRDPLTGLFNRRYLDASLLRECLRARRAHQHFAVLLLDIDDFKRFNDQHGHQVGDAALTQVGNVLNQTVRSEDIACRYGGEEFLIISPDTDLESARDRAELLRQAIRAAPLELHGRRLEPLSISAGIAVFPLHGGEPGLLIEAAHKAIAAAKKNGRDRSEVAEVTAVRPH